MTVYVDELFNTVGMSAKWKYKQSCHMKADTEEELHAMAAKLGLKREWCQYPDNPIKRHYDLTASKRALALKYGAVPLTWREMAQMTTDAMREAQK
jgi:Protein of unknown function (DUF4031)